MVERHIFGETSPSLKVWGVLGIKLGLLEFLC